MSSEQAGHNSGGIAGAQLLALIERIERLEEEVKAINSDKSDIYKEAKAIGFDTKAMKQVVALRRLDHAERKEREAILELYLSALNMA